MNKWLIIHAISYSAFAILLGLALVQYSQLTDKYNQMVDYARLVEDHDKNITDGYNTLEGLRKLTVEICTNPNTINQDEAKIKMDEYHATLEKHKSVDNDLTSKIDEMGVKIRGY